MTSEPFGVAQTGVEVGVGGSAVGVGGCGPGVGGWGLGVGGWAVGAGGSFGVMAFGAVVSAITPTMHNASRIPRIFRIFFTR